MTLRCLQIPQVSFQMAFVLNWALQKTELCVVVRRDGERSVPVLSQLLLVRLMLRWHDPTCIPCTGELTAGSPHVTCLLAHKAETGFLHFCWLEACYGQSISKRYSVTFRRHTVARPNVPLFFPIIIVFIMTVP